MKTLLALLLTLAISTGVAQATTPQQQGLVQATLTRPCRVGDVCATTWLGGYRSCELTNVVRNGGLPLGGMYGLDLRTTLTLQQLGSGYEVDWVNHTGRMLPHGLTVLAYYYCAA
jgi:hypothetical protein